MPELQTSEQQQPLHLPADRREMILRTRRELAELEGQKKEISEKIKSTKHRLIKGALGWKMKDWAILEYLCDLEHEDRDQTMRTLHEGFAALDMGQQLDWISATGADRKDEPHPDNSAASGPDVEFTAQMGYEAGLAGKNADLNPHVENSIQAKVWDDNWLRGQTEIASRFAPGERAEPPPLATHRRGRPRKALH